MNRVVLTAIALLLGGCIVPDPPPMNGTAADPQLSGSSRTPRNLTVRDETTRAIEKQLSLTDSTAAGAEKMPHDMGNMPGMEHGAMPKMPPPQQAMSPAPSGPSTAPAMSGNAATGEYYTCVMHPQIHADAPGNCPICGMKLVKKEADE